MVRLRGPGGAPTYAATPIPPASDCASSILADSGLRRIEAEEEGGRRFQSLAEGATKPQTPPVSAAILLSLYRLYAHRDFRYMTALYPSPDGIMNISVIAALILGSRFVGNEKLVSRSYGRSA